MYVDVCPKLFVGKLEKIVYLFCSFTNMLSQIRAIYRIVIGLVEGALEEGRGNF